MGNEAAHDRPRGRTLRKPLWAALVILALLSGACSTAGTAPVGPATAPQDARPAEAEVTPVPQPSPGTSSAAAEGLATATSEPLPARPEATAAPQPPESTARGGGLPQALRWVAPSLVRVRAGGREGTGFAAFQPDQVLTAFNALGSTSASPTVLSPDGVEHEAALVGVDEDAGLALLSVPKRQAPLLTFASGSSIGESVVEVGYTAGGAGEVSITRSTISARPQDPRTGLVFLQVALGHSGDGGSPLLNEQGRVVGMTVVRPRGGPAPGEGQGLAVAAEAIPRLAAGLRRGTNSTPAVRVPAPGSTAAPGARERPSGNAYVVREYPEMRADGGLYLVQQWSDGRFTSPLFILPEAGTSPVQGAEARVLSFLTRPGASCETRLPESSPRSVSAEADAEGRVWMTWYIPRGLTRGATLFISISCKYGTARLYTTEKVPVDR